ncbi:MULTISPECIES: DUF1289 domain-containing protein [Gammaproteobacteria]|uniref:DUF1289 domain-containing protein n=1 Tax=Gammaproteobacteria TaxID=1236 RepID=UPI0009DB351A|nr:DUF1289 domain-containing protein [Paraglaciecola psychrophila]
MKQHQSPCIDICEFTGPKRWCLGCGRTRHECEIWKEMKPYARNRLMNELQKRMFQITDKRSE